MSFSKVKLAKTRSVKKVRRKKIRQAPLVPILFVTLQKPQGENITLRALCDSGAAESLISERNTKGLKIEEGTSQQWSTVSGNFKTSTKATTKIKLI